MSNALFKYPNVVGYGTGERDGKRVVAVLVSRKLPLAALSGDEIIPTYVFTDPTSDDWTISTDVLEVGFIQAPRPLGLAINRKGKHRPAPGGVSIGHYKISAGTLGSRVIDVETGDRLILSNNHVLANSNNAEPGDLILQPGTADGGRPGTDDEFAKLLRFQPILFGTQAPTCPIATTAARVLNAAARGTGRTHRLEAVKVNPQAVNVIDAAVALPNTAQLYDRIEDLGIVTGVTQINLGDPITKSGRTTETTTGRVLVLDATVQVSYGPAGSATFEGQIIGGPMSAGGDSGSLGITLINDDVLAFGLLFAGSDQVTIYNPIEPVLQMLNITF